jgi:hypothetical protein
MTERHYWESLAIAEAFARDMQELGIACAPIYGYAMIAEEHHDGSDTTRNGSDTAGSLPGDTGQKTIEDSY